MELLVDRAYKKDLYCIGRLYINGKLFSNTLEDRDRGLNQKMSESEIKARKVYGETAIPTGVYKIDMNTVSPKFNNKDFYKKLCKGKVPRLVSVKGFSGVLIHCGTKAEHSFGCILVGKNTIKGGLTSSKEVFTELYNQLKAAHDKGEQITITIK